MSEATEKIMSEFEKGSEYILGNLHVENMQPDDSIDPSVMDAIKKSRLDLTKDIPDPQMLVSVGNLPMCTRGNFSFVIGLPGARKSFLCTGIAGSFLSENGCMGLDNPNGTGKLLWIDTEQADGHVAKIGRRLHRIAGLPTDENSENIIIHMLREYQPDFRLKVFTACINLYNPDFIVLDGVSDLISDPNNSEQATYIINELMGISKNYNCHILTVIHANVGSEKARGHLGSEALRKCETAIFAEAKCDVTLCKWVKTRDMRPDDFAFTIKEGLPVETAYVTESEKEDRLRQIIMKIMPPYPATISYTDMRARYMQEAGVKGSAAEKNIKKAAADGYIVKNQVGSYYLPQKSDDLCRELPF